MWDSIFGDFKGVINDIIDIWNKFANLLQFTIPSWVPGIGGDHFGLPTIPNLAEGGIIPATPGGQLVRAGEAGSAEAIVPLSQYGLGGGQGSQQSPQLTFNLVVNGQTFATAMTNDLWTAFLQKKRSVVSLNLG